MISDLTQDERAKAEQLLDVAGAVEDAATTLCHWAATGWTFAIVAAFRPEQWWGYVLAAIGYLVFYLVAKSPYDKSYDAAFEAYKRATETGGRP